MESADLIESNIDKISNIFPNVITEIVDEFGNPKKVIDFEKLKIMLTGQISEDQESYTFTWPGKKRSLIEAHRPTRKTLLPIIERSSNWNETSNIIIEGDNLDALKIIQESYLNKIDLIYIDPPYNTGNDFIYKDKFHQDQNSYLAQVNAVDKDGYVLTKNVETNGRFHSDWCSMIYPRLLLARNLLSNKGSIFISVDDHEADNLKKICDEIFGENCFVGNISWQKTYSPRNNNSSIATEVEHILVYSRLSSWTVKKLPRSSSMNEKYKNPDNDVEPWKSSDSSAPGASSHQGMVYAIQNPFTGELQYPPKGRCWSREQDYLFNILNKWAKYRLEDIHDDEERASVCNVSSSEIRKDVKSIILDEPIESAKIQALKVLNNGKWPEFYFSQGGKGKLAKKTYLENAQDRTPTNLWLYEEVGHTDEAKKELKKVFNGSVPFDTPKPTRLINRILDIASDKESIILDFFAGSATTAEAVLKKNIQDQGSRKFILVQIPEIVSNGTYTDLCEVGEERIRRFADYNQGNIKSSAKIDMGFRTLRVATSNMKDVYYSPENYQQDLLSMSESNIKEDRTDLDLLFGCLLDWGLELSKPYKSEEIASVAVHTYDEDALVACFAENVPEEVIREIAKRQPLRAVFRDSSFGDDAARVNLGEIFKLLSPDTEVKVL